MVKFEKKEKGIMRKKALKALLALLACCLFPAAHGAALEWKPETAAASCIYSTVAVRSDGTVWAWGGTPKRNPYLEDVVAVTVRYNYFLALKSDGTVWDFYGTAQPEQVTGLSDIISVSGGVALKKDGTVWQEDGAMVFTDARAVAGRDRVSIALKNDGTVWILKDSSPVQAAGLSDITAITTKLALDKNGTVWKLETENSVQIKNLSDVIAIASGDGFGGFSMALKKDGTVWQWGQLGPETQTEPVQIQNLQGVIAIAAGYVSLAIKPDGSLWAWGPEEDSSTYMSLGDNYYTCRRTVPTQISGLTNIQTIAAGKRHAAAVTMNQSPVTWGYNNYGQLGDGTSVSKNTPVMLNSVADIAVCKAAASTFCLKNDNTVWAWGIDYLAKQSPVPVQTSLTDVQTIGAGDEASFAVKSNGSLWGWGGNYYYHLRLDGGGSSEPIEIAGISDVQLIESGHTFAIAVKTDKSVWTWGTNKYGQLGRTGTAEVPGQVPNLSNVSAVAAGDSFALAVQAGNVWAWGYNVGNLGDGTVEERFSPVKLSAISDVVSVAAGDYHSLALKADRTVWSWGQNDEGQLGDGTFEDRKSPVQVSGLSDVREIAAGEYTSYALKNDGTVWAWGLNTSGQIGDGTAWSIVQVLGEGGEDFFNLYHLPSGRKDYTLAYFPPLNRVILHGGWTSPDWLEMNDLWKLDETGNWSELVLESTPAFSQHSMTYDSDREVMILCGKKQPTSFETWEFAGTLWTKKTDTQTAALGDVEIAFDPDRTVTVLYAGQKDVIPETWEYDGYSWNKKNPAHSPPGFDHGASLRYDEKNRKTVLVGYEETLQETQTWTWNGTDWTRISGQQPENSLFGSMAYDSARQNMVFLTTDMKTWTFDGTAWTLQAPAFSPSPAPLSNFTLAWHPVLKVVLFFGGENSTALTDPGYPDKTWAWNGVFWSEYPGIIPAVIGDLNNDGEVDLADVILALQISAGIPAPELRPGYSSSGADVNGDHKAGIEEALFGMRKVSAE